MIRGLTLHTTSSRLTMAIAFSLAAVVHAIAHPSDLNAPPANDRLPIVVWGNGACRMDGLMFERYLTKIASHGFHSNTA